MHTDEEIKNKGKEYIRLDKDFEFVRSESGLPRDIYDIFYYGDRYFSHQTLLCRNFDSLVPKSRFSRDFRPLMGCECRRMSLLGFESHPLRQRPNRLAVIKSLRFGQACRPNNSVRLTIC